MARTKTQPNATSSDYDVMLPYWQMVDDIMGGAETMRAATTRYLPQFEQEDDEEYKRRVATSPFTPLYADAFRNLASKPFKDEVQLGEDAREELKDLSENVDAAGNHLHVFARSVFGAGVNKGIDWIWVGHTDVPEGASVSDRRNLKARPFWARIPAERMLAVYEDTVDGKVLIVHARFDETVKVRDGYDEDVIQRVRVLDRERIETEVDGARKVSYGAPTFQLFERRSATGEQTGVAWELVNAGALSIDVIPLVPFVTGERDIGSFIVKPPLRDLAYMQITEYQMESNRSRVQTMTAFPVSVFQGVDNPEPKEKVPLGPRSAFFFPPFGENGIHTGDFKFVEPDGNSAQQLREDLSEFRREMREAGMQPLTKFSGTLTATEVHVNEAKAHSAVEMWALALKDAIEQAFVITAKWLGLSEDQHPNVRVSTDFAVGAESVEEMNVILTMEERGIVSPDQVVDEALRRDILGPDYDRDEDMQRILDQIERDVEDRQAALEDDENLPNAG